MPGGGVSMPGGGVSMPVGGVSMPGGWSVVSTDQKEIKTTVSQCT